MDGVTFRRLPIAPLVAICAALFVTWSICAHGVPILRHDWSFPITSWSLPSSIETLFQPWLPTGIGVPQPYPTFYATGFLLLPLALLPPVWFMSILVCAIALLVSLGGVSIGRSLSDSSAVRSAAALLALFNPWVYSEFVAGHILMVLAYGVLLWTASELLRPEPRAHVLVVCCAFMVSQLEFFVFAFVPLTWWLVRSKRFLPLVALCVAFAPIAAGLVLHYSDIRGTPFLLEWQRAQSIALSDALVLRGYFAHYDSAFDTIAWFLYLIPIALASAIILAWRERATSVLGLGLVGIIAILCATGTRGPIGPLYSWLVTHVTEIGLFRELYDLIAFGAVASIIAFCFIARVKAARFLFIAIAVASVVPWAATIPSRFFVPQSSVSPVRFQGGDHERVALFPIVQPVKLGDAGSGYDYDLFAQYRRAWPINTFFPAFPTVNALEDAAKGNTTALASLGVSSLRTRPNLAADWDSLRHVFLAPASTNAEPEDGTILEPYPLVGVIDGVPQAAALARDQAAPAIFFADAAVDRTFRPIEPPRESTNPNAAWIDARLAFFRYPSLATAFGGAFTSSDQPISVPFAPAALVWTNGSLILSTGETVASHTPQLEWKPLPPGAKTMRCMGTCAVIAVGKPGPLPMEAPVQRPKPVDFTWFSPWLLRVEIPTHDSTETLRFSDQYDRSWTMLGFDAKHVRLNEVLNGWILPPSPAATGFIVDLTAALQFALEIGAMCTTLILFFESKRRCSES